MTDCDPVFEALNYLPISEEQDFNYTNLAPETRIVVQQRTSEIKTLVKRNAQDVFDIGQKLIEVKEHLGHGRFEHWLKSEFAWSERTARKYMSVTRQFKTEFKTAQCADLDIAASALYLLAASSTPEEACAEALELASAGETITYSKANGIVKKHKPRPVTINATAETVELVSSIPVEVPPSTHTWQQESDQESEIPTFEEEYPDLAPLKSELGAEPLIDEGGAGPVQLEVPESRVETFQPLHANSDERRTLSDMPRDRNRPVEMDPLQSSNEFADRSPSSASNTCELPTVAVDAALACMREIDRLNTTFPSAGFYLGIQLEGFSRFFDGIAHPLEDIFSVNYLREAVVLRKLVS